MNNWRKVTLREVVTILGDGLHGTPKFSDDGDYYFINGNNLINGKIVVKSDTKRTTEEEYKKYKKHLNDRTILVSINGTLGNVALYNNEKCILGKSACYFNVKEEYAKMYIRYTLSDKKFQQHIFNYADGTTIKNVSLKTMREYSFMIPENIDEQKRIADVLSALDDKIEINNKINENLEAQAQAIFKQWFVDFEFPDKEGKPYKTNGGKFIDSELGEIPVGWKVGTLGDVLFNIKNTIKKEEVNNLPYLPIDIIPMNKLSLIDFKSSEEAQSSLITFGQNDILIGAMRVYFHRVSISPFNGVTRSTCFVLRPKKEELLEYLLLLCNQNETIDYAQNTSKGTTMPYAVWDNGLSKMKIIIPSEEILHKFSKTTKPIITYLRDSLFENKNLSEIRDSLLPKLMSGEVRV